MQEVRNTGAHALFETWHCSAWKAFRDAMVRNTGAHALFETPQSRLLHRQRVRVRNTGAHALFETPDLSPFADNQWRSETLGLTPCLKLNQSA